MALIAHLQRNANPRWRWRRSSNCRRPCAMTIEITRRRSGGRWCSWPCTTGKSACIRRWPASGRATRSVDEPRQRAEDGRPDRRGREGAAARDPRRPTYRRGLLDAGQLQVVQIQQRDIAQMRQALRSRLRRALMRCTSTSRSARPTRIAAITNRASGIMRPAMRSAPQLRSGRRRDDRLSWIRRSQRSRPIFSSAIGTSAVPTKVRSSSSACTARARP